MSFRDRIKKILKIALPIIAVLFAVYHMLFYTVKMSSNQTKEFEEDYGEYILCSVTEFSWYVVQIIPLPGIEFDTYTGWSWSWSRSTPRGKPSKNVILFRWDANNLKKKMKKELKEELETLKQQHPAVTDYTYDEDNFIVDVYMDESKGEYYYEVNDHIKDIEEKFYKMARFCKRVSNSPPYKWYAEFNIHRIEDETNVEDVYAEDEQKALEEILSRSKKKFDDLIERGVGAWGKEENIFHLTGLDLSSYDDITGELDFSGFTKLRYVCLENTKADKVILPESLEYIDSKSFRTCMNLEEIIIPASVEKIYGPIFWGCKNLKKVTFEGDAPEVENEQRNVFGKVSDDFKIYHRKSSEGWENRCWRDYEVVEIE